MRVRYQAKSYSPGAVAKRYVRLLWEKNYVVTGFARVFECEYNKKYPSFGGATIREYDINAKALPKAIYDAALKSIGFYPSQVEWPLDNEIQ